MCDPSQWLWDFFHRFITIQVKESEFYWLFWRLATHRSKKCIRGLQSHVLFVKIGDLHREILAEIETHVDDAKCLWKKSNEKCLCQKNTKSRGRHLDFAEYQTKKGKRDNRTLTVGVRQVQKHSYEVRFCPSYLLDTLLCSESGKRSLFLPKWSKLRLCTVRRRRSLQMKMKLADLV